jgi:hypothetical protein
MLLGNGDDMILHDNSSSSGKAYGIMPYLSAENSFSGYAGGL